VVARIKTRPRAAAWQAVGLALLTGVLASCGGGGGDNITGTINGTPLSIRTLSNRADLISDGDALVEVQSPPGLARDGLTIKLNGTDVTSAFVDEGGGRYVGRVTGLANGANTITAEANKSQARGAKLTITNSPRSGPVLSGAQIKPFYCATPTSQPASGDKPATLASGLSGQPDDNCNIPTETKFYYRTTATSCSLSDPGGTPGTTPFCWQPYTTGTTPADMATTTNSNGVTVPYIVRLERGTMNRGIYDIAVLFDPNKPWTPTSPQAGWNQKIYYSFGVSTGQPRRQARTTINWWTLGAQIGMGYLVAQNSMTDSSRNSNRVLMAETTMMMKEHIIDTYGEVKYTLGTGCSGGSINSNMNLSIMPGTLDGVITSCTYPDSETTSLEVGDCTLLVEAYQKSQMLNVWNGLGLSQAQINARKGAINGHPDQSGCQAWYNAFGSNGKAGLYFPRTVGTTPTAPASDPTTQQAQVAQFLSDWNTGTIRQASTQTNNCELPNSAVYDPANPTTTASLPRCNAWSWGESIWGKVPGSPAANDTRDNEGVQYGLKALLAGTITAEEFVTLNEVIGGNDRDSTPRAQRSVADTAALNIAYKAGIVASGKNLAKAAIIDLRGWDDSNITVPPGYPQGALRASSTGTAVQGNTIPIHHEWFSFAIRDRIQRDAGDANNQALWRFARTGLAAPGTMGTDAVNVMDQWLTALVTSPSSAPIEQRVRVARPASSKDFCLLPSDSSQTNKVFDQAQCDADPFLKPSASPRQVAGGPRSEDILKCQLKPFNVNDYPAGTFSGGQVTRLQAVFSTGVCDWSKPGVGQQSVSDTPLTFKAGPGGQPLGAAPTSTAL
jgi:hypothetical protein